MQGRRVVAALRQPEYTGENRCYPCTVLNLALVGAASVVVGNVATPAAAVPVAVLGAGLVYVRGYLVPGTPALTERFLPSSVLAQFEHTDPEPLPDSAATEIDLDPEKDLVTAGALQTCADREDLCLDPMFRSDWRTEMVAADQNLDAAADRLLPPEYDDDATVESRGDAVVARVAGTTVAEWPSREAFVADAAGAAVLEDADPEWDDRDFVERTQLLAGLRLWLGRCSRCDGRVELGEDSVESCCRSVAVVAASCTSCGARIFEAPLPEQ